VKIERFRTATKLDTNPIDKIAAMTKECSIIEAQKTLFCQTFSKNLANGLLRRCN